MLGLACVLSMGARRAAAVAWGITGAGPEAAVLVAQVSR
jgi:hypothetical protein